MKSTQQVMLTTVTLSSSQVYYLSIHTLIELHVHMNKWLTAMLFMKEKDALNKPRRSPPPPTRMR